jgi:hypothetical protein
MTESCHEWKITGNVRLRSGRTFGISPSDILMNSFSMTNQCCSDEKVDIGQVYMGEMKMTVLNHGDAAALWTGAVIDLTFSRWIPGYNWNEWSQPVMLSDDTYGIMSASSDSENAYLICDENSGTEWKSSSNAGTLYWTFPVKLKLSSITLTNGRYETEDIVIEGKAGEALTGNDGLGIYAAGSVIKKNISKTVNIYSDADKKNLLGSGAFPDEPGGDITVQLGGAEVQAIVIDLPDSYGSSSSLSEIMITAEEFADDAYESVPIGVWNVSESSRAESGVSVICCDNMTAFEYPFDKDDAKRIFGSDAYYFLKDLCSYLKKESGRSISLGSTKDEIHALINGKTKIFSSYSKNNQWESMKDVLSSAAAVLGGYATIGRNGKLYIKNYSTGITDTITEDTFFHDGFSFSNEERDIRAVRTTLDSGKVIKEKNGNYGAGIPSYTIDLGQNPFISYKKKDTAAQYIKNIAAGWKAPKFAAFTAARAADPCYDLGDVLSFVSKSSDSSCHYVLTKFEFDGHRYVMTGSTPAPLESSSSAVTGSGSSGSKSGSGSKSYLRVTGSNMADEFEAEPELFKVSGIICFPDVYQRTTDKDP